MTINFEPYLLIGFEIYFFAGVKGDMCELGGILPWRCLQLTFLSFTIKLYLVPDAQTVGLGVFEYFQRELSLNFLDFLICDSIKVKL